MTVAYLDAFPPRSAQFRRPRRERLSGVVVVHTSEQVMDTVGPDTGAENLASFIRNRTDPGSYHVIVDSDSALKLIGDDAEAFQVAVNGHNRHAWGISAACAARDWDPESPWTISTISRMGQEIRDFWSRNGFTTTAGWLSRDQAEARRGPGLVTHGDLQPADRTDAWTRHPQRYRLDLMLLGAIGHAPLPQEDDMGATEQAQIDDLKQWVMAGDAKLLKLLAAADQEAAVDADLSAWIKSGFTQLLARKGATVDVNALADALAETLGPIRAEVDVDEVLRRAGQKLAAGS